MANIKSQIKRNRQNEKRRLRNKSVRAELRTRTKTAVTAAESGAEDSAEALRLAVKRIDKAAAQGVIHKNTAANHKSRLVRRVAAIEASGRVGPVPPGAGPGSHCRVDHSPRWKVNIFAGTIRAPRASASSSHASNEGPCLGRYSSSMA